MVLLIFDQIIVLIKKKFCIIAIKSAKLELILIVLTTINTFLVYDYLHTRNKNVQTYYKHKTYNNHL